MLIDAPNRFHKGMTLVLLIACCALTTQAYAQRSGKLLTPAMISLAHAPDDNPEDVILRLTSKYGQSGCQKIGNVSFSESYQDTYLDIGTGGYTIDMDDLPAHPEYQCGGRVTYPSAAIPVNISDLKKNSTQQIRFGGAATVNYYDIVLGNHYIELIPAMNRSPSEMQYQPMELEGIKNPLKLWLYPKGTVILRASKGSANIDVRNQLDNLARTHGLVPLETVLQGFTSPLEDPNNFYYVDKSKGKKVLDLPGITRGTPFGEINVSATVYGATGDEKVDMPIKIFARTPGAYE